MGPSLLLLGSITYASFLELVNIALLLCYNMHVMIDPIIDNIVEVAISIVFGIFVINKFCEFLLCFDLIEYLKRLIDKITGSKREK